MKRRLLAAGLAIIMAIAIPAAGGASAAEAGATAQTCMISASTSYSAMLTPDGYMMLVGDNEFGWIGNGQQGDGNWDTQDCIVLKPYAAMKDVAYISVQDLSCFAIKKDHTLWSWGFDHESSLGNGNAMVNGTIPYRILDNVKFVATGHALHMLAIKEDNTLWAWGQNDYGQLGDGTKTNAPSPVKVMSGVKYAAVGYGSSAVIKNDNSLWMWGRNDFGELGNGTKKHSPKPAKVLDNVATVTLGFHRTCALKRDGTVWAWGQNDHGEIGDGTTKAKLKPVKVLSDVVSISTKANGHILAVKKDGTVWAWGNNSSGEIGDGTKTARLKPVKVMSDVKMVDTNDGYSMALKKDNTVWAWGNNDSGQLGTGDRKPRAKPTKVMDLEKASANGSCTIPALFLDGRLEDWKNQEPIIQDPVSDAASGQADIESVYGYMDKKYVYLAVKVNGSKPELHVGFNRSGTGSSEYDAGMGSDQHIIFINKAAGEGSWTEGPQILTCNYDNSVFEMMIPLSAIGNPSKTSIWLCTLTLGDKEMSDETKGWTEVPVR